MSPRAYHTSACTTLHITYATQWVRKWQQEKQPKARKKTCCVEDNSGSQSLLRRIGKTNPSLENMIANVAL